MRHSLICPFLSVYIAACVLHVGFCISVYMCVYVYVTCAAVPKQKGPHPSTCMSPITVSLILTRILLGEKGMHQQREDREEREGARREEGEGEKGQRWRSAGRWS